MNTTLNYIVEANFCLLLPTSTYWLLLRNESQFIVRRVYLLLTVLSAGLFPLLHLNGEAETLIPTLANGGWLPELVILNAPSAAGMQDTSIRAWEIVAMIYLVISLFLILRMILSVARILLYIARTDMRPWNRLAVAETDEPVSTFSFFHFIVIGQANTLSPQEKESVLLHERVHASQFHSIDLLLAGVLRALFWFNPVTAFIHRELVKVHEFEADRRAADAGSAEGYCRFLAELTIREARYRLVNYFDNSFILKRITMIKKMKNKMNTWKLAIASIGFATAFVITSCRDQVLSEVNAMADETTLVGDFPPDLSPIAERIRKEHPGIKLSYLETSQDHANRITAAFPDAVYFVRQAEGSDRYGLIVRAGSDLQQLGDMTQKDQIFLIVEEAASPVDSMTSFYRYVAQQLKYPDEAVAQHIEGRVFVEFVIQADGVITNVRVLKGIGGGCDEEAIRVLRNSPPWNPARQHGQAVAQRMVLPISFKLDTPGVTTGQLESGKRDFDLDVQSLPLGDGRIRVSGIVKGDDGTALQKAHILVAGTTHGVTTGADGSFDIVLDKGQTLLFSYIGYASKDVRF